MSISSTFFSFFISVSLFIKCISSRSYNHVMWTVQKINWTETEHQDAQVKTTKFKSKENKGEITQQDSTQLTIVSQRKTGKKGYGNVKNPQEYVNQTRISAVLHWRQQSIIHFAYSYKRSQHFQNDCRSIHSVEKVSNLKKNGNKKSFNEEWPSINKTKCTTIPAKK